MIGREVVVEVDDMVVVGEEDSMKSSEKPQQVHINIVVTFLAINILTTFQRRLQPDRG